MNQHFNDFQFEQAWAAAEPVALRVVQLQADGDAPPSERMAEMVRVTDPLLHVHGSAGQAALLLHLARLAAGLAECAGRLHGIPAATVLEAWDRAGATSAEDDDPGPTGP